MRAAVIQLNSSDKLADNLFAVKECVAEAANDGATLAVLPENFALMPRMETGYTTIAEQLGSGAVQAVLAELAQHYGIWIIAGSLPIMTHAQQRRPYSSQLLFSPEGKMVAHYHKIHLFDVTTPNGETYCESDSFTAGNTPCWHDIEGVRTGLSICYDVRFPELYRTLVAAGCRLLIVPAAFTRVTGEAHWHTLLRARAVENQCYVLAAAQEGVHANGRTTYGHSMIIDPWGSVLTEMATGEGVASANIDLEALDTVRARMPVLAHRQTDDH